MPANCEELARSGSETVGVLTQRVQQNTCDFLSEQIGWAESQLTALYRKAVEASTHVDEPDEIAKLWKKAEDICEEVLHVFVAACGEHPECPTQLSNLFDIKMACHEQQEFHRCS